MARAKLTDLYKSLNDIPLIYENVETLQVKLGGDEKTELKISNQTDANGDVDLSNVTLEFKGEKYEGLEFKFEEVLEDHDNEGKDALFVAESDDKKFEVEVNIEADYDQSGRIQDVEWRSLETFPIDNNKNERKKVKKDRRDIEDVPEPGDPATSIVDGKIKEHLFYLDEELKEGHCYDEDGKPMPETHCMEEDLKEGHCYDEDGKPMPEGHCYEENVNEMVSRFKKLANIKEQRDQKKSKDEVIKYIQGNIHKMPALPFWLLYEIMDALLKIGTGDNPNIAELKRNKN